MAWIDKLAARSQRKIRWPWGWTAEARGHRRISAMHHGERRRAARQGLRCDGPVWRERLSRPDKRRRAISRRRINGTKIPAARQCRWRIARNIPYSPPIWRGSQASSWRAPRRSALDRTNNTAGTRRQRKDRFGGGEEPPGGPGHSQSGVAAVVVADADGFGHVEDEDLAVADFAGARGGGQGA